MPPYSQGSIFKVSTTEGVQECTVGIAVLWTRAPILEVSLSINNDGATVCAGMLIQLRADGGRQDTHNAGHTVSSWCRHHSPLSAQGGIPIHVPYAHLGPQD